MLYLTKENIQFFPPLLDTNSEVSNEELRQRLQETLEVCTLVNTQILRWIKSADEYLFKLYQNYLKPQFWLSRYSFLSFLGSLGSLGHQAWVLLLNCPGPLSFQPSCFSCTPSPERLLCHYVLLCVTTVPSNLISAALWLVFPPGPSSTGLHLPLRRQEVILSWVVWGLMPEQACVLLLWEAGSPAWCVFVTLLVKVTVDKLLQTGDLKWQKSVTSQFWRSQIWI